VDPTVEAPYWVSRASSLVAERREVDILAGIGLVGLAEGLSVFKTQEEAYPITD
jgi:hypothetical protein